MTDDVRLGDECSENRIVSMLARNRNLDGMPMFAWKLRRVYWLNSSRGHTAAVHACVEYAAHHGVELRPEGTPPGEEEQPQSCRQEPERRPR